MQVDDYRPGTPCWVDLGTTSPDDAAGFYGAVFGWSVAPAAPNSGGYRMALLGSHPVAGIGPVAQPGIPPSWTTYISVDSADETARRVADHGGAVLMPPMDVFSFGRMAVFQDPQGAVFAVWQPGTHVGAGLVNEANTLAWNELMADDVESAKDFYGAVFGWTSHDEPMPEMTYTTFQMEGQPVAGMMPRPPGVPAQVPSCWNVYFAVDDVDATCERAAECGGSVMMGPMDIAPGRFAVLSDPQGAPFHVIKMAMLLPE